jgi:hypothetical protein
MHVPIQRCMTVASLGVTAQVSATLGHDLITGNHDRQYLVNKPSRVILTPPASAPSGPSGARHLRNPQVPGFTNPFFYLFDQGDICAGARRIRSGWGDVDLETMLQLGDGYLLP